MGILKSVVTGLPADAEKRVSTALLFSFSRLRYFRASKWRDQCRKAHMPSFRRAYDYPHVASFFCERRLPGSIGRARKVSHNADFLGALASTSAVGANPLDLDRLR